MHSQLIIDSHIHMYPKKVWRNAYAWGMEKRETHWVNTVAPKNCTSIQGWADVDQLLRDMDAANIAQAVMLGWYWQHQATCDCQNQWYIDWVKQHPDRLMGFAIANPTAGQRALDSLRAAIDAGLIGFGEFLPQVQGYDLRHDAWCAVVELAIELNVPINLHVTEPVGHAYAGRVETPLADYMALAQQFPECRFILAHWGGLLPFYELNKTVSKVLKNVYYDTAASPLLYSQSIYRRVIDTIGADKILFGTDYPLLLQPGQTKTPSFNPILNELQSAQLSTDEANKILYQNAARLLQQ